MTCVRGVGADGQRTRSGDGHSSSSPRNLTPSFIGTGGAFRDGEPLSMARDVDRPKAPLEEGGRSARLRAQLLPPEELPRRRASFTSCSGPGCERLATPGSNYVILDFASGHAAPPGPRGNWFATLRLRGYPASRNSYTRESTRRSNDPRAIDATLTADASTGGSGRACLVVSDLVRDRGHDAAGADTTADTGSDSGAGSDTDSGADSTTEAGAGRPGADDVHRGRHLHGRLQGRRGAARCVREGR